MQGPTSPLSGSFFIIVPAANDCETRGNVFLGPKDGSLIVCYKTLYFIIRIMPLLMERFFWPTGPPAGELCVSSATCPGTLPWIPPLPPPPNPCEMRMYWKEGSKREFDVIEESQANAFGADTTEDRLTQREERF